jgi:hypothetical protein
VLYFQRRRKPGSRLDGAQPPHLPRRRALLAAAVLALTFALAGLAGAAVPRGAGSSDPALVVTTIFLAFGLVWLPALLLVLGALAFNRYARAGRL